MSKIKVLILNEFTLWSRTSQRKEFLKLDTGFQKQQKQQIGTRIAAGGCQKRGAFRFKENLRQRRGHPEIGNGAHGVFVWGNHRIADKPLKIIA